MLWRASMLLRFPLSAPRRWPGLSPTAHVEGTPSILNYPSKLARYVLRDGG
jgi:hypothetical protein